MRALAALTCLFTLAACQTLPPRVDDTLTRHSELATVNPNNIAVLPIEDATPGKKLAALDDYIRKEIGQALIAQRYSPLFTTFVDAHVRGAELLPGRSIVEASYLSGVASEADAELKSSMDAIFAVRVRHWDESTLLRDSRVRFQATVSLFGARGRKVLWQGRLWGDVIAGGKKAAPRDPRERARAAAREFVRELISRLPRRQIDA